MAKKIKFPLILRDDYQARTLDELREYFDFEKILNYYQSGKLLTWLQDRYYDAESSQIESLKENQPDFVKQLYTILGVPYQPSAAINLEEITEKQKRLEKLKQFTSDETILNSIDRVAFDQEELADILDEDPDTIYLCENIYRIPLRLHNKHYIGIGKAQIVINADPTTDFSTYGIQFTGITLLRPSGEPFETYSLKEAEHLYLTDQGRAAVDMFEKLVTAGDNRAKAILGEIYMYDFNFGTYNRGYALVKESASNNDILGQFFLAENTTDGFKECYKSLFAPLKAAAADSNAFATYALASYYEEKGEHQNFELATRYFQESANHGYWRAYRDLGWNYKFGRGVSADYEKAKGFYQKNADRGDWWSQIRLGELLYYNLGNKTEGLSWYRKGFTKDRMKSYIQTLIGKIDNLQKQPGFPPYISFSLPNNTEFRSRSAAYDALRRNLQQDCQKINNKIFSYEQANIIADNYCSDFNEIFNTANLYGNICENTEIIGSEDISAIKEAIRNAAINSVNQYKIDASQCTYEFSDDDLVATEVGFGFGRFEIFYSPYTVISAKYGLDYEGNQKAYYSKIHSCAKELLKPIKSALLALNTEALK